MTESTTRQSLVTGATSGVGRITALALAARGDRVTVLVRNEEKGRALLEELREAGGPDPDLILADLSILAEVQAAAATFLERNDRLDVLVNNAGALFASREETPEGLEKTFALNHLAYFLLTRELLPLLKASAPARIVNVASDAHRSGEMRWDDLQHERWTIAGWGAYAQSKLANVLFTRELARRIEGSEVTACAIHPGFVGSNFARNNPLGKVAMTLLRPFARSSEKGAETVIWAATDPEVGGANGRYYFDRRERRPARAALDEEDARRLWEVSEALIAEVLSAPEAQPASL